MTKNGGQQDKLEDHHTSPRFRSLLASGLVTSTLKFCCVSLNFVVFLFAFVHQKILLCSVKFRCVLKNIFLFSQILLCSRKDCCVLAKIVVFSQRLLCSRKFCCVLEKIVVFSQRLLCSRKDCCVLAKIVVFSKRLLCSRKDCCVSEDKLSCVLPLWATVANIPFYASFFHNFLWHYRIRTA